MTDTSVCAAEQLGPDYFQDPLGYFARMREGRPVTPMTLPGDEAVLWTITRYADVRAALADPRLHKDWERKLAGPDWTPDPATGFLNRHMLNADPPDHTRLRRLVQRAFTPGRVAALRPRIEAITASLLDAMGSDAQAGKDEVDLIAAFAFPLPMTVISELIGVPDDDRDEFSAWSHVILSSTATADEFHTAGATMQEYFMSLIAAKRAAPADDLLSALIMARDAGESGDSGDSLNERELLAMMFLLLVAGHETTANLIASGVLALLDHPAKWARLRADPALLRSAVEELLRYANPLNHATERFTLEPVEIGGVTIPARSWVLCATSSANRDPDRFDSPDVLDIGRDASGHVAFGHGIHYCLGAPLARLEGEIAFGGLLSRFPGLALAVDPATLRWRPSSLIHGLETLPVRLG